MSAYSVILKRGEFTDAVRGNRCVPYKIYYPDVKEEKFPVILWSHGFGGNRDGASFISRHLCAMGYVLVHITHIGTDSSLWEGHPGHPWDILRSLDISRETTLNRFCDISFVIDQLSHLEGISKLMDMEHIGMSGHSFGALTTQVLSGQLYPNEHDDLISLKDERIKAAIAYSPVAVDHVLDQNQEHSEINVYETINVPFLSMTGTEDSSPISGAPYNQRLKVFEQASSHPKYSLVKEGGDHMIYNGTRGKLAVNPKRELHEQIILTFVTKFFDAMLKEDDFARDWLDGDDAQDFLLDEGEFIAA